MPKYRPETAKAKAKKLAKDYIAAGLNQSKLARKEKVSHQNINQKLQRLAVQQTIAEIFDKAGATDKRVARVYAEALGATKVVSAIKPEKDADSQSTDFIDVPDWNARLRAGQTVLEVKKHIRADEDAKPMKLVIEYGHRKPKEEK